ncbi:MAG: LOG family protein, partial [Blastocatellia bacterium]|nr:LOG family protein [Blastocatellia bacterium]
YYRPLLNFLESMVTAGTISRSDLDMLLVTDSVEEAMAHIEKFAVQKFHLKRVPKPSWVFGER